ncbi:DUF2381 family protein [Myxococcaceae bacterium GXIMD 01537]
MALSFFTGPALSEPCLTARHIELPAGPEKTTPPVCISAGQATVFSFDAPLEPGSVTVERAESFAQVERGPSMLKLKPSERLPLGEPLRLTVRFADGAEPTSATFTLVAHAALAEPFVDVHRQTRTVEAYQQELRAKEQEIRQLREENARLRADKVEPGGLRGLWASRLMREEGVATKNVFATLTESPAPPFRVRLVRSYRSASRVAVLVELHTAMMGAPTWTAGGATLTREGKRNEALKLLPLWQEAPVDWEIQRGVMVEAEATADEARGTFTLKLWEEGGTRTVTLRGVTFP